MKKSEKLRREADALKYYADTLAVNHEVFRDVVMRTDNATKRLMESERTPQDVEVYRAEIHRINLNLTAINRHEVYANAKLRAELRQIEAEWTEVNE